MPRRLAVWVASLGLALAATLPATGVAAGAPAVTLSDTSLNFSSVAWLQAAPTQNVVLTNTGDAPLSVQTIDISGQPYVPEDFTIGFQVCTSPYTTIAPGAQCQIPVNFRPQSGGPRSATMTIWDNAPGSPQSVALRGVGTGAVIMFTPRYLDFGTVPAGTTSAPLSFSAVNAGDSPVTFSSVKLGPAPWYSTWFAITGDACSGATLGPGQPCAISVTVTPTAVTSGAQIVNFFDDAGTGEQTYDGSIIGLNAAGGGPLLSLLAPVPSFKQGVGTTSPSSHIEVFNAGTQPLQISSVALNNATSGFAITSDGCSGVTLAVNSTIATPATCDVEVAFAPPGTGSFSANLVFQDNELSGSRSQAINGNGYAPVAVLSTPSIDFGFQAVGVRSAAQFVTLTNPSPQALTVTGVSLSGTNPGAFSVVSNSCSGVTVAPGGNCMVGVTFTPPFPYLFSAKLSFVDNAPGSPQVVSLRGEGQAPTFIISTSDLNFGNQHAGVASAAQTVTVTNTSSGAMSYGFLSSTGVSPSGCSGQIAAGTSCTVSVTVTPPTVGSQSATLKIFDSVFNQQVVEVAWAGTSGSAFLTDGLVNNQLIQAVGSTRSFTAVVRNSGTDLLKVGQVYLTGNPPATISSDQCSNQSVSAGNACTFLVTTAPTVAGSWQTTITVPTDAVVGPNPATMPVYGYVAPLTDPVTLPPSLAFSDQLVGSSDTTQIVWFVDGLVPSLGAQPTSISTVTIAGADASAFRIVWDGCTGLTIDPAYSCPVSVGFDPTAGRTFNASLVFSDDANNSPHVVPLSGLGLAAGGSVSPRQIDFGSLVLKFKSDPATVTLTSSGNVELKISRVSISGGDKDDFTIKSEDCQSQTLAPGATCQVVIVFRPTALGTRSATLTFTDNGANSPQSVPLTGTGVSK